MRLLPASLRDSATSTAVATIGDDGAASYEFDVEWDLGAVEVDEPDWIHVGSIATFLAPGADAIEHYLDGAQARVSYDPNIRAALLPSVSLARERFERIAGLSDVLKLSDEDASWLYPGLNENDLLDRLFARGPTVVAITRAANGAVIASPELRLEVAAVSVDVRDTVGAGDSFMAALIAELMDDKPLDAAATTAIAAAAITCSRSGAQLPTRAELDAATAPQRWA